MKEDSYHGNQDCKDGNVFLYVYLSPEKILWKSKMVSAAACMRPYGIFLVFIENQCLLDTKKWRKNVQARNGTKVENWSHANIMYIYRIK